MIIVSFLISVLIILFILRNNLKLMKNSTIILCSLIFAIQVFFWFPRSTYYVDTVGYFSTLDQIKLYLQNGGISSAWQYIKFSTPYGSVPVMGCALLICSLIGNNGILLLFTAFLDVLFVLLFLKLVSKNDSYLYSVVAFFCLFNFSAAIGGIRNDLIAIIGCYILTQRINKKINWINTYIFLTLISLIHPFGIIFIIVNLILDLFHNQKIIMFFFYILLICQKIIQPVIFKFLMHFSGIPYVQSILNKSTQYFGENATLVLADSTFSKSIIRFCFVLLIFIVYFILQKKYFPKKYNQLCIIFVCFALGSISNTVLFGRIMKVLIILVLPYIGIILSLNIKKIHAFKKSIILLTVFMILLFNIFSLADNLRAINTYYELEITKYL